MWKKLKQPTPGTTGPEHRASLKTAIHSRRNPLSLALQNATAWLSQHPTPWDPRKVAHPVTLDNRFKIAHGSLSKSPLPPPPQQYHSPEDLPKAVAAKPAPGPTPAPNPKTANRATQTQPPSHQQSHQAKATHPRKKYHLQLATPPPPPSTQQTLRSFVGRESFSSSQATGHSLVRNAQASRTKIDRGPEGDPRKNLPHPPDQTPIRQFTPPAPRYQLLGTRRPPPPRGDVRTFLPPPSSSATKPGLTGSLPVNVE